MPVIDGRVDIEKLDELIREGAESETLDYKQTLDLDDPCAVVEFAKDVGAMELRGGYLVVGADDAGRLTGRLSDRQARLLDEATVRAKLHKFLTEPLELRTAVHRVQDRPVAVIYVGPHHSGWRIFGADGTCQKEGKVATAFRKGDVYARHGTASEPWQPHDIKDALARVLAERKEEWRKEFAADMERVVEGERGARLAAGPATALTWRLDEQTLLRTVIEQLRRNDDIPLRLLLRGAGRHVATLIGDPGDEGELATLLNRLTCLAALLVELERWQLYELVVNTFVAVYNLGFDGRGIVRNDLAIPPAKVWLDIDIWVMALGALLVRKGSWEEVRRLVLRRGSGEEFQNPRYSYNNWLRHALTMAARAGLLSREGVDSSVISLALELLNEEDCLRPDLPPDEERLLDSLCQFDLLACVVAMDDAESTDGRYFYPNFSRFYSQRSTPVAQRLLEDPNMRASLFRGNDENLAIVLNELDRRALSEGMSLRGWHGFPDSVEQFIREHLPAPEA
jgi:hypothetical protein